MLSEQAAAKVVARNFVFKCSSPVGIAFGFGRFHLSVSLDKGVVKRVDVDSSSVAMVRKSFCARDVAKIEGRSVVGRH